MNDPNRRADVKNKPCSDILTKKICLSYLSKGDAILAQEELWSTSSISTSIKKCSRCGNYHLLDAFGFPLTIKDTIHLGETADNNKLQVNLKRPKCHKCLSSDGKEKTIFTSSSDAQNYINALPIRVDYGFAVYSCPHGNGLHLTKNTLLKRRQQVGIVYQEPPEVRDVPRLEDKLKILTELAREKHLLEQAEMARIAELIPEAYDGRYQCPKCLHEWTFHDLYETFCECGSNGPFKVSRL